VADEKNGPSRLVRSARHRLGDLQNRDRSASIVVGTVADRVEARRMRAPQAVDHWTNPRPLVRCRFPRGRVGTHWPDDAIECAHGIMIDGRMVEADVIVVRRERDVFAA